MIMYRMISKLIVNDILLPRNLENLFTELCTCVREFERVTHEC